jgi:hypothetical protein
MISDDIKTAFTQNPLKNAIMPDGRLLIRDALTSDLAFVLIGLPAPDTSLLIAADGSALMIEDLYPSDEFDDFIISDKDILATMSAQDLVFDARDLLRTIGGTEWLLGVPYASQFKFLGLSSGARKALEFEENTPLADIASALRKRGFDPKSLNAAIKDFADNLEEPLFCPEDDQNWSDEDSNSIAQATVDCLCLLPESFEGEVQFMSANSDYDEVLLIDSDERYDVEEKIQPVISRLFDFKRQFAGRVWDYTDGARNRKSGYADGGASIFNVEISPSSQHDRLAAMRRLTQQLKEKDIAASEIQTILAGLGQPASLDN